MASNFEVFRVGINPERRVLKIQGTMGNGYALGPCLGVKGMGELITIESIIEQHINNQLDAKLPMVVSEQLRQISPPPVWMTEKQLAEYWQLRTPDGEVTVHSIRKWTARSEDEHPLPCASMGEMRRYHREEVDRWAREEAARQKKKKRRLETKVVETRMS